MRLNKTDSIQGFQFGNLILEECFRVCSNDDLAKGVITQFWKHFTVIPCAFKDLKWYEIGILGNCQIIARQA